MTSPWSDPAGPVVPSERGQFAKPPYGQPPYGQQPPPAYGYGDPPPAYGSQYGGAYPPQYPPAGPGWGAPPVPYGLVAIPGGPPLPAATPGQRALGRLYDSLGYVVLFAGAIAGIVVIFAHADGDSFSYRYEYGYPATRSGDLTLLWIYPILGGVWLIIVLYEALTIGLTGATLGQRLAGVRFVNAGNGGRPGFWRGVGRAALLGASFIACYGTVFLLLLFSMFFDSQAGRYQSWVDKIFGLQAVSSRG